MKSNTKTIWIYLILVIAMVLLCSACAETPKENVVIDKSNGIAKENIIPIDNNNPKKLGIPQKWCETITRSDGFVTVEANHEIKISQIYNTPVFSYAMKVMTKDDLFRLCDYFAGDNKIYEYPKMTKDELINEKNKIINFEGRWAAWDTFYMKSYWSEKIEILDKLIKAAPESNMEYKNIQIEFTTPYETEKDYFNGISDYYYSTDKKIGFIARIDKEDGKDPIIRVINYDKEVGSTTNFLFSQGTYIDEIDLKELSYNNSDSNKKYEQWINGLKKEIKCEAELSEDEAMEKVHEVLEELLIKEFEIVNCVKAIGNMDSESWALLNEKGLENSVGYSVYLTRRVENLVGYSPDSFYESGELPETVYVPYFPVEQIRIIVTKEGIQRFEWTNLSNKVGTVADNVKLLTFDQIKEYLADHLLYSAMSDGGDTLRKEGTKYLYDVKNVEIRMANINAYEDPFATWLVPVWVFELERTGITETGEKLRWGTETVVLNAIDGGFVTIQSK